MTSQGDHAHITHSANGPARAKVVRFNQNQFSPWTHEPSLRRSQDVAAKAAKVLNKRLQTTQEKGLQRSP